MNKYHIITNDIKDNDFKITGKIREYLESRHCSCSVSNVTGRQLPPEYHYTDPSEIPDDTECIIVLGGDGTLLQAARDVVDKKIPLFGINLGTLGYLAEVDREHILPALDALMTDRFKVESRMMLHGTVFHKGKEIAGDLALNDIVLIREGILRVVNFRNYINGSFLNTYSADGIIISTPTGSTGYNLSAGGPIIEPGAAMILMTPLAPHTLNSRSIIFSPEDVITIEIGPGRDGTEAKTMASFDGDTSFRLVSGDRIEIRRAAQDTGIIKLSNRSFLEVLGQKMSSNL